MEYKEEQELALSGLQHFAFCPRQWALIHIEQQWKDNYRTIDGHIMHEKAHDGSQREKRGDLLILRNLPVRSSVLGIRGNCDVVEFHRGSSGITLHSYDGLWEPFPVEYKRGQAKETDADRLQLCAQAMCLEEMLCCEIEKGALFYGETHRRETVVFTNELRDRVKQLLQQMHELFEKHHTPKPKHSKNCNACSLQEICLPKLHKSGTVSQYFRSRLEEE